MIAVQRAHDEHLVVGQFANDHVVVLENRGDAELGGEKTPAPSVTPYKNKLFLYEDSR